MVADPGVVGVVVADVAEVRRPELRRSSSKLVHAVVAAVERPALRLDDASRRGPRRDAERRPTGATSAAKRSSQAQRDDRCVHGRLDARTAAVFNQTGLLALQA